MHPAVILLVWLFCVSAVQVLPAGALAFAVLAALAAGALLALQRTRRLVRRVRVLLAAIFILFAWFTPGEAWLADFPRLSPTREGLALALEHGGRLLAVVCCVALLLEALPPARLVAGLHVLCRPLGWIGISPERLALRLLLVLHYVESVGGHHAHDWKTWLLETDVSEVAPLALRRERYGWADAVAIGLLLTATAAWVAARVWP